MWRLEEVAEPVPDRDLRDLGDAPEVALRRLRHAPVLHDAAKSLLAADGERHRARRVLDEPQPVLELGDAELELLELVARDEAELREQSCRLSPARSPSRVASPRQRVSESSSSWRASSRLHPAPLGELAGELVDALGRQRDGADRGQREPLEQLAAI